MTFLLKAGIAAGLIWLLFQYGALDFSALRSIGNDPATIFFVILLCLLMYAISAYRWQVLLSCQSIEITHHRAANVTFLSLFLNCLLPCGGIGGDAFRIAYVARAVPERKTAAILSVLLDRGMGLYSMITVGALAALVLLPKLMDNTGLRILAATTMAAAIGIPAGMFLLYCVAKNSSRWRWVLDAKSKNRIWNVLTQGIEFATRYMQMPGKVFRAFGLSIIIQVLAVFGVIALGGSMGFVGMTLIDYAFALQWGWISNLLPLTPGGLGVGEAAFDRVSQWLMAQTSSTGLGTVFLAYRLLAMVATFPGLILYLCDKDVIPRVNCSVESI